MKRIPLIALLLLFAAAVYSQSWVSNATLKQLYTSPDSTRVGIGIWNPSERLHVNKGALKIGNSSWAAGMYILRAKTKDGRLLQSKFIKQ